LALLKLHFPGLESDSALFCALRFVLYMAVLEWLTYIPFSGAKLRGVWSIAETCIEYLGIGLILHLAMRLFGGKARAQTSVSGYS
jgi:hypothetical protein